MRLSNPDHQKKDSHDHFACHTFLWLTGSREMKTLVLGALLFFSTPAFAENVVIPFSGSLSLAYGDFMAGQKFSGLISYDREAYDEAEIYPHFIDFLFDVGSLSYTTDVVYAGFNSLTGVFGLSGARSDQTYLTFTGLKSTVGFLPTAEQFAGARGVLDFKTVHGTGEDSDPVFSGGTGIAYVAPVPEPATWASMIAGLALAGGVASYRRRKVTINPA
jgi:hypothetical protein